ncbi:hypothetical protein OS493_037961 [Desmophyllum pertusum]|uniref:BEN domain-containing protein n=1 Tax=Desmophyllum pertusum TaxID=174260 RepID=A0A9X0CHP1_9CNID|nr:hypothetical protein OS493_037961 [Desmophyllum pertusum]
MHQSTAAQEEDDCKMDDVNLPQAVNQDVDPLQAVDQVSRMLVGGNGNVALPRHIYLDSLIRYSEPTHFAVRLAELAFGHDTLKASTVMGGKQGTQQLDPTVIEVIQTEVTERFQKEANQEQQAATWRKCIKTALLRDARHLIRYTRKPFPVA